MDATTARETLWLAIERYRQACAGVWPASTLDERTEVRADINAALDAYAASVARLHAASVADARARAEEAVIEAARRVNATVYLAGGVAMNSEQLSAGIALDKALAALRPEAPRG